MTHFLTKTVSNTLSKKKIYLKVFTVSLFLWSAGTIALYAQEAIPATGGEATGSGGSVSYTVGQVAYSGYSGTNGSTTEGVQQPYEIYVITGTGLLPSATLSFRAFPNPATDYLILDTKGTGSENLSYQLSDINGKIVGNGKVTGEQTTIAVGIYRDGNYFLRVLNGNEIVKAFKIVKSLP